MPRKPIAPEDRKRAPGGGRKPILPKSVQVNALIPADHVQAIDNTGIARCDFIRDAVSEKLKGGANRSLTVAQTVKPT